MAEWIGQIAGYELVGTLGRGTTSLVHLARPPARLGLDDEVVCLKVLAGRHTPERFRQATDQLRLFTVADPARLATAYEAGRAEGTVWFSMAHHRYGSLVDPAVPLSREDLLHAVAVAARGAHALHELGMAHGNIKPSNVLLAEDGPKLADVDLGPSLHPELTLTPTALLADVELVDPALVRGHGASRATDIWSLGMTLHRVLTGGTLYPHSPDDDMITTIRRIGTARPEVGEALSPEEAKLVLSCLAADPRDRPSTARTLAEAIEGLL